MVLVVVAVVMVVCVCLSHRVRKHSRKPDLSLGPSSPLSSGVKLISVIYTEDDGCH